MEELIGDALEKHFVVLNCSSMHIFDTQEYYTVVPGFRNNLVANGTIFCIEPGNFHSAIHIKLDWNKHLLLQADVRTRKLTVLSHLRIPYHDPMSLYAILGL